MVSGKKIAQQNYGQELLQLCLHRRSFLRVQLHTLFSLPSSVQDKLRKIVWWNGYKSSCLFYLAAHNYNSVLDELLITFGYTQTWFYLPAAAARWWLCSGVHFPNWPDEGALLGLLKTCLSQSGLKECSVKQHQLQNKESPVDKQAYFKTYFKKIIKTRILNGFTIQKWKEHQQ